MESKSNRSIVSVARLVLAILALPMIIAGGVLDVIPVLTFGAGISTTIVILGILSLIYGDN